MLHDLDIDTVVKIPVTKSPDGAPVLGPAEKMPPRPRTLPELVDHVDRCIRMVVAEIEMIEALMVRKPGQRWHDKLRGRMAERRRRVGRQPRRRGPWSTPSAASFGRRICIVRSGPPLVHV